MRGVRDAVQIAAGLASTCAVRADGALLCWGRTVLLGDEPTPAPPAPLNGLPPVAEVRLGASHACARARDGRVLCWGNDNAGQLGRGRWAADEPGPQTVGDVEARTLALGCSHSCAVHADGGVSCWGASTGHRLGCQMWRRDEPAPVSVCDVGDVVEIVAGCRHTCVRTTAGGVHCWGDNSRGQLGRGDLEPRTPAAVDGIDAVRIGAGYAHTCAVTSGGEVRCWGENRQGQLGDGGSEQRSSPVTVVGLPGPADEVGGGESSSCARIGHEVWCWGFGEPSPPVRVHLPE